MKKNYLLEILTIIKVMKNLSTFFLFFIALSTTVIAVQLRPISRKAYLFNLCRDFNSAWNESSQLSSAYKSGNKKEEEKYSKSFDKTNYYLSKIYKEFDITPALHGQEAPYTFCQRIGFDWYIDEL